MSKTSSTEGAARDGNYVVVARRYRPRGFDELVGQEHVGRALRNAIETNRVGHAYLFTGARGVGKTSTARIFAKALNDPTGPTANPDNASDVAQAIDSGEDVDVIEIDGASNRGIDEIRSLRANVGVRPSRSRYKIYIIDEVHMLTGAAFNALLKTLEEPPEHVKFIFCTTDPEKIPITVLSRCQRFDFAPVEVPKIVGRLREIITAEGAAADDAALELIARRAAGSMRDSQSLLEQVLSFSDGMLTADQVHAMLGTADDVRLHALATAMASRDAAAAMQQLDAAIDAGVDAGRLAEQLLGYFRDLMAATVGCDPSLMRHTSASLHQELKDLGGRWGLQTVLAVVGLIDQTLVRIRLSVHSRVLLEATLIQICTLPDLQSIVDLAAAADAVGSDGKSGEKKKLTINAPHLDRGAAGGRPTAAVAHSHAAAPATSNLATSNLATSNLAPSNSATSVPASAARPAMSPAGGPVSSSAHAATATVPRPAAAAGSGATKSHSAAASHASLSDPSADEAESTTGAAGIDEGWNQATAQRCWKLALGELESMTESLARAVSSVTAVDGGRLRLTFPGGSALMMRRCELPEHKQAIADALSRHAGQTITLEFQQAAVAPQPKRTEPVANKPSRVQRMREIESNPLIQSCVELFDAEIVRVDRPR